MLFFKVILISKIKYYKIIYINNLCKLCYHKKKGLKLKPFFFINLKFIMNHSLYYLLYPTISLKYLFTFTVFNKCPLF